MKIGGMDDALPIQLFWFASAVPVALEAFKASDRARLVLGGVAAAFAISGFAWPSLSARWPTLQRLVGELAQNPSAWFAIAVAVFFVLRPYWTKSSPQSDYVPQPYDDSSLQQQIREMAEDRKAIINDYQRMSGLEAKLLEKIEIIRNQNETNETAINHLTKRVAENRSYSVGSLYAIWAREESSRLEKVIRRDASDLYDRLERGEIYDSHAWSSWESVHSHWDGALRDWLNLCRFYAPAELENRVYAVNETEFLGSWSVKDGQFPTADANRRFKRHRIIHRHWEEVVEAVNKNLHLVAFQGMSEDDVKRGTLPKPAN